jgi:hypothetical protein
MALLLLLLGMAVGFRLGLRYTSREAMPQIREEYERIDRQDEYWDCLQEMVAETNAWANESDSADWWKRGEDPPF